MLNIYYTTRDLKHTHTHTRTQHGEVRRSVYIHAGVIKLLLSGKLVNHHRSLTISCRCRFVSVFELRQ